MLDMRKSQEPISISSIPTSEQMTSVQPAATEQARLRSFCVTVYIDYGKPILADRMLQATGAVQPCDMCAQYLDCMDIERKRGITIKSQVVHIFWAIEGDDDVTCVYALNMTGTSGYVNFSYEANCSLMVCESTIPLVNTTQSIQAQTLANLYMAIEGDLTITPALSKIDPPAAEPEKHVEEIVLLTGCDVDDVLKVSGKTGQGVPELLDRIVETVPPPYGDSEAPVRAIIFDSVCDTYRGMVTYVRVVDGAFKPREHIEMFSTKTVHDLPGAGVISPEPTPPAGLGAGEVGYLITGVKDTRQSRVGDTAISAAAPVDESLSGYQDPKSMVFSGLFPADGSDFPVPRDALDKLKLDDTTLIYESETFMALGFGSRCGYPGLLHLEIIRERLEREFNLNIISIAPSVVYEVTMEDHSTHAVISPSESPEGKVSSVSEPVVRVTTLTLNEFVGTAMELCQSCCGITQGTDHFSESRVEIHYVLSLAEIVFDFFDALKSRTRGYTSLDYEADGSQDANLVKVGILLNGDKVDAFSAIVHRDSAYSYDVMMIKRFKNLTPRQQLEVPV